jgi:cytochrome c biogenesis protein CcmG, thiol:disulfide interchange protein DsbE
MKFLLTLFAAVSMFAHSSFATAAKSNVGKKIAEINAEFLKEKPVTAGKPLMVEFWATWCGPCVASIPHINKIHKEFGPKGLVVIGLSDEKKSVIKPFAEAKKMEYHVGIDNGGKLNKQLKIQGIPHAVLVNKAGEIVWEGHPGMLQDADIEKLLK